MFFSKILNVIFGVVVFCIILGLVVFYEYTKDLPSYDQIINYKPDATINIYADNGEYLASIFREDRIVIKNEDTPQLIKNAIIAAEDKSFYENSGLDYMGILRALFANVSSKFAGEGKIVGGSTITQQIIKNTMLSKEKTLKRKIQEAKLAIGLNKYLSKDQILERYINHIYLGNNSYGFAQASLNYLNKSIDDLTIEDAAFLAALPQAPSRLDPTKRENHERLVNRRNWIIDQMLKQNFISQEEHDEAIQKPIIINKKPRITQNQIGIEYCIDEIKKKLFELSGNDEDFLYQGGYLVHSTIVPELQKYTTYALRKGLVDYDRSRGTKWDGPIDHFKTKEEYLKFLKSANKSEIHPLKMAYVSGKKGNKISIILNNELPEISINEARANVMKSVNVGDVVTVFENNDNDEIAENGVDDEEKKKILDKKNFQIQQAPKVNGAIVVMDVKTGNVLAMSGGFSYYKNQFNRATQAMRQPGSSFKPLIYLTGLENGFSPYSILLDEPIEISQGKGLPTWKPKNYGGDFAGPITMQSALERSRNLATLYLAREIGMDAIVENAKKFKLVPENYNEKNFSMAFGSEEVTLLNMVRFYSIIANGGFDIKANFIEYIQDRDGKVVWKNYNDECPDCNSTSDEDSLNLNPAPPIIKLQEKNQLIEPKIDYQLLSMMEGVVRRGTAASLAYFGGHMAGKTGTSNDSKDTWFV